MHVIGCTNRPYNEKMYYSEEYAFKHPINFTTENKDTQLEVELYLNGQNATEYLEVGESNLFTLTDENGNAGYVYITYAVDPNYHFWGLD